MCTICNKFVINIKTKNLSQYEVTFAYKVTQKTQQNYNFKIKKSLTQNLVYSRCLFGQFPS